MGIYFNRSKFEDAISMIRIHLPTCHPISGFIRFIPWHGEKPFLTAKEDSNA
jgi:hypothetical protein